MEVPDFNIDNYELKDLLNLFDLPEYFDERHLKSAKILVMKLHPDKSKLKPEYFLFYSKAYKMLLEIFEFKNKNLKKLEQPLFFNNDDETTKILLDETKEFNVQFNEFFEKCKINEDSDNGYGDWLKTNDGIEDTTNVTFENMGDAFEKKKIKAKELVVYEGIQNMVSSNYGTNLDGVVSNDSNMFSSLAYQDLKKSHLISVIPVSNDDFNAIPKFTLEEYKNQRNNIKIPTKEESEIYLKTKKNIEEIRSNETAFKLAKQMEEANLKKNIFLKEFKLLN
jgi:hypothetical protein